MTLTEGEHVTPRIGIIIPPPDVRNIVDRTADFVARNGPEFEARVKINEANNPKFNFLNSLDPYNAYYNQRVKQCIEGTVESISAKISVPTAMKLAQDTPKAIQEVFEPKEPPPEFEFIVDPPSINGLELDIVKLTAQFVARNGRQFLTQLMNREQRNYLFDFLRPQHNMFSYFTKLVEQFTKILLPANDIIDKLDKEARSPDMFMKNCKYRVAWDRYQARQRKKEMEAEDKERVAYGQIDWHDFVVVEMVDYQPNEVGNFPPPTVPEEVGARSIAEERGEAVVNRWIEDKVVAPSRDAGDGDDDDDEDDEDEEDAESDAAPASSAGPAPQVATTATTATRAVDHHHQQHVKEQTKEQRDNDDMEVEDMEMSDDEDAVPGPPPMPPSGTANSNATATNASGGPPAAQSQGTFKPMTNVDIAKPKLIKPEEVLIKPYDPKTKVKKPIEEVFLISPLGDNKKITTSQANKHIHVGLLDPGWKEHRDRNIKNRAQDDSPYASGNLVDINLKTMAERRTDIFGTEETVIGRKVGEEDSMKGEKYIWDGHTTTQEPLITRPSEVAPRPDDKDAVELDRIGPQAIPQMVPASTITIIVNTPITVTAAVSQIAPPLMPPSGTANSIATKTSSSPMAAQSQGTFKPMTNVDIIKPKLIKTEEVLIKPYDPKTKVKKPIEEISRGNPGPRPFWESNTIGGLDISRLGLLEPGWISAQGCSPYGGEVVQSFIKMTEEIRTDIFGAEETVIGRKVGEEDSKKGEKYIWDGHTTTQEPFITRPSEVAPRADDKMDAVELDRIGPQAIPQVVDEYDHDQPAEKKAKIN